MTENEKSEKPPTSDWDAADTLPLSIILFESPTLRSARLLKTSRLETMLEVYKSPLSGSLQIPPSELAGFLTGISKSDREIIVKLARLHSYDVFSLRYALNAMGLCVDHKRLELSEGMKTVLNESSLEFTRPMIRTLFGDGKGSQDGNDLLRQLLRDPDVPRVKRRLQSMSETMGIPLHDMPRFLNNYRDLFLALAYYQHSLDNILPTVSRFVGWVEELKSQREVSTSPKAFVSCSRTTEFVRDLCTSTHQRLNIFKSGFSRFWDDMSPESFERLRKEIEDNYAGTGAVLCGVGVKMRDWSRALLGNAFLGTPARIKYVMTELEPGLEQLVTMENTARRKLGMKPIFIPYNGP